MYRILNNTMVMGVRDTVKIPLNDEGDYIQLTVVSESKLNIQIFKANIDWKGAIKYIEER